jgi:hypothetical protein
MAIPWDGTAANMRDQLRAFFNGIPGFRVWKPGILFLAHKSLIGIYSIPKTDYYF